MASFIYPRTVAFHRPADQGGAGRIGYGGQIIGDETPIASGIPASIQERKDGPANPLHLPTDAQKPNYYVFIPRRKLANGTVQSRDVMIDDLGNRYQVVAPYWDSMGYRLSVVSLET